MILAIMLPRMGESMRAGQVHRLIAQPGDALRPGSPLLEVRVDLEEANARDCPAVIFFRLIAIERAHLRTLQVVHRDLLEIGSTIGIATSTIDEEVAGAAQRALRTASVAIHVDPLSV